MPVRRSIRLIINLIKNNMFKKIIAWIVQSSEDPSQISLTLKGIIVTIIPWIVTITGVFHLLLSSAELSGIGAQIVILVQSGLSTIGTGIFLYGLIRKLINTFLIPWPTEPSVVASVGAPKVI